MIENLPNFSEKQHIQIFYQDPKNPIHFLMPMGDQSSPPNLSYFCADWK